jgi:hypothetical protein
MGHVACIGEMRHAYLVLVRKPEGKRPLRRWEDLGNWVGSCELNACHLGKGPVAGSCEHG